MVYLKEEKIPFTFVTTQFKVCNISVNVVTYPSLSEKKKKIV